ncbi:MAG: thymidine phosphorylase [Maricaulis sp.]|nr:thymidine phosphorylase [Maricaulis sp.]
MPDPDSLQSLIRLKRDGGVLSSEQIAQFVTGITDGRVSDAQLASFAMATFLNGMSQDECFFLTRSMARSGERLDWSQIAPGKPVLDKHSTGGVGDNASLILAPLIAAVGCVVPMISGRGLGHTGGTLDKLEAIPGYNTEPSRAALNQAIREAGCAIIGQSQSLVPADRRFYAVRDVTSTVESIPLITASILSKKLAAGLNALVLDVKVGSGAFTASRADARALASCLLNTSAETGLSCRVLLTDMNQPMARAAGNALEVRNAINFLTGDCRETRQSKLVEGLATQMLIAGGLVGDAETARNCIQKALSSGKAAECFERMVSVLGGSSNLLDRSNAVLGATPYVRPVYAQRAGWVKSIDARVIGECVVDLGGGRRALGDKIDPLVGLTDLCERGQRIDMQRPLCLVHARSDAEAERAARQFAQAINICEDEPVIRDEVIMEILGEDELCPVR